MKSLQIRGLVLGNGVSKICAPIVGRTEEEIVSQAGEIADSPAQIAEWRADFAGEEIAAAPERMLERLREVLGETLLLVTFRTRPEGGERSLSPKDYLRFCRRVYESGRADLLDVELSSGESLCREIICGAEAAGVRTIVSGHFFDRTPERAYLNDLLVRMEKSGASILKIAAMPQHETDVLSLMQECRDFHEKSKKLMICISMGSMGLPSRLCTGLTGSCITFGAAGKASAPGQISVRELDRTLRIVHGIQQ